MSFGAGVKAELAHLWPNKSCCLQAELAGFLALGGRMEEEEGGGLLSMHTSQAVIARLVYRLIKACSGVKPRVVALHRSYHLIMALSPDFLQWLEGWPSLLDHNGRHSWRQLRRKGLAGACCRRAFLRGGFLATGSVNNPRSDYHLEMLLPEASWGSSFNQLVKTFGLKPRLSSRRGTAVLYFKDGEQIAKFLNVVEAHAGFLEFESTRVYKEVRSSVNRLVNCDTANVNRIVEASVRQTSSISYLKQSIDMSELPSGLREVAELRLSHPDASLRELGQMVTPRISKAAVGQRLRRLEELAASLAGGKDS